MLGCAKSAEGGTVMRLFHSAQDEAADANLRLPGIDLADFEEAFGIVLAKFVAQLVTAFGNRADSAPFAIADLKNLVHQVLGHPIPFATNDSRILVFYLCFSGLELPNG